MNKLTYTFNDYSKIQIDLLENDFVNTWLNYFINLDKTNLNFRYDEIKLSGYKKISTDKNILSDLNSIQTSLNYISTSCNLNFDELIDKIIYEKSKIPNIDQGVLNDVHRTFTRLINNQNVSGYIPIDTNKILFENLHNLNDTVHRLESYSTFTFSHKRKLFKNKPIMSLGVFKFPFNKKTWIKSNFDPLIDNYNFDVWLNDDILGKDMIRSYLDDDFIQFDDITGNLFITPNLELDPSKNIKNI
jgi:hypothetical protein